MNHIQINQKETYREMRSATEYKLQNLHYLQGGIVIEKVLNKDWLVLAFQNVCSYIPVLYKYEGGKVISIYEEGSLVFSEITDHEKTEEMALHFKIRIAHGKTKLSIKCLRSICDGWSLILFFRELEACYDALRKNISIPELQIADAELFNQWLGKEKTIPFHGKENWHRAGTVAEKINIESIKHFPGKGSCFKYLLASFATCLGKGTHTIGVPVAGQWMARQLKTFGPCTCHIPVIVSIDEQTSMEKLMAGCSRQLAKGKRSFRNHYHNRHHFLAPLVFNVDRVNGSMNFAGVPCRLYSPEETDTRHHLVCNVSVTKNELVVSMKYNKMTYTSSAVEEMLENYCNSLVLNVLQ